MPRVRPQNWTPVGIDHLEANAWDALTAESNTCVVAGPGAGKTEFLAQRAAYLLQTGICPPPYRILAISFKTDAAANLTDRIRSRCPAAQASRFTSLTFDAFTKGLLDRFARALPDRWRLKSPYELMFPKNRDYRDFLQRTRLGAPAALHEDIVALNEGLFEAVIIGGTKLPTGRLAERTGREVAISKWWSENFGHADGPYLSFTMINRLVELLLRSRPHIVTAIRQAYPFVFVDEFQDTTYAQYDLLSTAFENTSSVVTAVGDNKQRIMVWAGARSDAFVKFERDFTAMRIPLLFNFRSSDDLVKIQNVVARALDEGVVGAQAQVPRKIDGDVAQIWTFATMDQEAEQIAAWLTDDMASRGTAPRDYAILVRQTADKFEDGLWDTFEEHGLALRNESRFVGNMALQDMLAQDLTHVFVALLRLAAHRQAPAAWRLASDVYGELQGIDPADDVDGRQAEKSLHEFILEQQSRLKKQIPDRKRAEGIAAAIVEFLDPEAVARTYQQYNSNDLFDVLVRAITHHLVACAQACETWEECVNTFEGIDSIPLMTIHKSKGLEFDTVLFVGLDDRTWWSHSPENPEGVATFFVALSRAKQRAIFTYCLRRGRRTGIADIYRLLADAGVPECDFTE